MKRAERERISVRIALAVGFIGTLGLWLYTNYAFTLRIETVQRDAAQVAARYTSAQELLATVRSQVMLSSVRVRDALLDPTPAALQECRDQLDVSSHASTTALADYEPVLPNAADTGAVARLLKRGRAVSSALAAGARRRRRPHARAGSRRAEPPTSAAHREAARRHFGGDPGASTAVRSSSSRPRSPRSIAAPKPRAATGSASRSSSASARCC